MKKLILFVLFLSSVSVYSQVLKFFYEGEEVIDTLNVNVPNLAAENVVAVNVQNISSDTVSVTFRKENITELGGGSYNAFCLGVCVGPNVMHSINPLVLAPGETSTSEQFHFTFFPDNLTGVATVKYTFTAGQESTVIVVNYICREAAGITQSPVSLSLFSAYPNPATSSVTVQYNLSNRHTGDKVQIIITNLVGNKVRTIPVQGNSGKKTIDLSNMVAGIYFYSMEINGRPLSTKKLIVK